MRHLLRLLFDLFKFRKRKVENLTEDKIHEIMQIVVEKIIDSNKEFKAEYWETYEFHCILMKEFMKENPYFISGPKQLVKIKKISLHYAEILMIYFMNSS